MRAESETADEVAGCGRQSIGTGRNGGSPRSSSALASTGESACGGGSACGDGGCRGCAGSGSGGGARPHLLRARPLEDGLEQSGADTTHFSVIDKEGNRVAATLSINLPFGAWESLRRTK